MKLNPTAAANIQADVSIKAKVEAALTTQLKADLGADGANIGSVSITNINAKGEAKVEVKLKADASLNAVTEAKLEAKLKLAVNADATLKAAITAGQTFDVTGMSSKNREPIKRYMILCADIISSWRNTD